MSFIDGLKKIWKDLTGEQKSAFISEALKEKELYEKFRELGFVTTAEEVAERSKERLGMLSLVEKINLVDLITEITTIGSLDLVKSISSIDLIKSISSIDLVKSITALGTVDLIKSITSIDLVKTITSIGTLDLLKSISSVDLIKSITSVDLIKDITSLDTLDLVKSITSIDLVKTITSIGTLNLINTITTLGTLNLVKDITSVDLIDAITSIGTLNLVNTISQITNIANLQSLDLIDSITSIDLLKSITSIGSLDLVKSITSIDLVKTITSIGTLDLVKSITSIDLVKTITSIGSLDLLKSITSIDLVKSITSIASLDLVKSITSIDLLKEITTIGTVNVAKVITSGLDNIVIDLLKVGAYTERRSTLSNNGATPAWSNITGNSRRAKFFPRGARGFIYTIDAYCRDSGASGGTITVYISPYVGAGYIASATITVSAGGGASWRSASFNRMWNYDSLFIFYVMSQAQIEMAYDADEKFDGYTSEDAGATWSSQGNRRWLNAVLTAETIGDIPVSGTLNTVSLPSSGSKYSSGSVSVPQTTEITLLTLAGSGKNVLIEAYGAGDDIRFYIYCDGVQADFLSAYEMHDAGYDGNTVGKAVIKWVSGAQSNTISVLPYEFRRELKITAYHAYGIAKTCSATLVANLIR